MSNYISASSYVRPFTMYKFVQMINSDYTSLDLYRRGIIDNNGNFLIPPETAIDEKNADPLEVIIAKVKFYFDMVPDPRFQAQYGNFLSLLNLFLAESKNYNLTTEDAVNLLEETFMKKNISIKKILQEEGEGGVPANSVGGGGIQGLGYPPETDEIAVPARNKLTMLRRKKRKKI
jgi:hypothetical protein